VTAMPRRSSPIRHGPIWYDREHGSDGTRVEMARRGMARRRRNSGTAAPLPNQNLGRKTTNGKESQANRRVD